MQFNVLPMIITNISFCIYCTDVKVTGKRREVTKSMMTVSLVPNTWLAAVTANMTTIAKEQIRQTDET